MKLIIEVTEGYYAWLKDRADNNKTSVSDITILDGKLYEEKPTGEWIPVSERLPEDEQEIQFSTKTGRVHSGIYYDDDSANRWYSHKDKCRAWNNVVNAWQPLPEPYKEADND